MDIFARRGTPVLAASAGTAYRVGNAGLGGRVVWVRDEEGTRFYYAHLDSQYVREGARVEPGDTLGFVGNTGNARTTPPHLHFGIYRPRDLEPNCGSRRRSCPIDPAPLLTRPTSLPTELTADLSILGEHVSVASNGVRLRAGPGARDEVLAELAPGIPLRVLAASGDRFRVRLPDGGQGYVAARLTRFPFQPPTRTQVVDQP